MFALRPETALRIYTYAPDWHSLPVRQTLPSVRKTKTEEEKNIGWVEFICKYKQGNLAREHHELSEFHKVKGAWLFYDGRAVKPSTIHKTTPDVGRNDPCPCGSGLKYKKCCGKDK